MSTGRTLLIASAIAAAMVVAGVVAASAAGRNGAATNIFAAASPTPTPTFKSNETATHEAGEPAARETAENNGTFHPGPGGPGGPGHSNETSAHETGESAAQEAAENARASASPTATH